MLKRMYIKNYALIEEISLSFAEGYQALTGETGSGKSIMLDAFSLALGERFDKKAILNEEEKCIIEIEFDIEKTPHAHAILEEYNLDVLPILTIRRELLLPSRMRSFINDTPCTLEQIQKIAIHLVDLHRQFDHVNLLQAGFGIRMIDAIGACAPIREEYADLFKRILALEKKKKEIEDIVERNRQDKEYNEHIAQEIEEAQLQDGETDFLEKETKKLEQADQIRAQLSAVHYAIEEDERSILQSLSALAKGLSAYSSLHESIEQLGERLRQTYIELKDIASTAAEIPRHFDIDNSKLEKLQERLSLIYRLFKKYRVQDTAELLEHLKQARAQIGSQNEYAEELIKVAKELEDLHSKAQTLARRLTEERLKTIPLIEKDINILLAEVGMPLAKWKIEREPLEHPNIYGKDDITLLIDSNGLGAYMPVAKVASGGELSRIMLCLKTVLSRHIDLPTMVFDEIDVGISGEVAKKIGKLLMEIGKTKQIICITHQASIAAMAKDHFYAYKTSIGEGTVKTSIKKLDRNERVSVLAAMLDGENPSQTSLLHAREMIDNKN